MLKKAHLSFYLKLFLSFILILVIPIAFSAVFYGKVLALSQKQADRLNSSMLDLTRRDIDSQLESLRKMEARYYLDQNVKELSRVEGPLPLSENTKAYTLYHDLTVDGGQEPLLQKAFIYFPSSDKIVSTDGNMDLASYYSLYLHDFFDSPDALQSILSEYHHYDTKILASDDGAGLPLMLLSLNDAGSGEGAVMGIILKAAALQDDLLSSSENEDSLQMMILSQENSILSYNRAYDHISGFMYQNLTDENSVRINNEDTDCWVSVRDSEETGWKYLLVTTYGSSSADIRSIQLFFIFGLLISVLLGFFLSWYLAGKTTNPIRLMMTMFQQHATVERKKGEDEFNWLKGQVETILQKDVDTQRLLAENEKQMQQYNLFRLLMGANEEGVTVSDFFKNPCFVICGVSSVPDDTETMDEKTLSLRRFIVENIYSELLGRSFAFRVMALGNRQIYIINPESDDAGVIDEIHERTDQLAVLVERSFHFHIQAVVSHLHKGKSALYESYREVRQLSDYESILGEPVILADDVLDSAPSFVVTQGEGEALIRSIGAGNEKPVLDLIEDIFTSFQKGKLAVGDYHSAVFELMGIIGNGAQAGRLSEAEISDLKFPNEAMIHRSIKETQNCLTDTARSVCSRISIKRKAAAENGRAIEIEKYIRNNFADSNLNISIAAQYFGCTPAYLSSIYKKQTGKSLLEFINLTRLDFADSLLQGGATVVEAASKSGFRDSSSFIRTYKRYRRVTPGQAKRISLQ